MVLLPLLGLGLFAAACNKRPAPFEPQDRKPRAGHDAPFDPAGTNPEWAFNNPNYIRPTDELTPAPRAKEGDPLHYFTNQRLVQVRQPADEASDEVPRVAVWWTDNNGFHWHRAGYFGRGQTFFLFEVEEDGDYGIRFVGPGQTPAVNTPAYPERVYHVDTHEPKVEVTISPDQSWYAAGQKVTISWRAADYHLIDDPVSIVMLTDFSADGPQVVELQRGLAGEGTITYEIPAGLTDQQVRFRVEALDRANNLGLAFSHSLQVVEPKLTETTEPAPDAGEEDAAEEPAEGGGEGETVAESAEDESAMRSGAVTEETDAAAAASAGDETRGAAPQLDDAAIAAVEMDLIGRARAVPPSDRTKAKTHADAKTTGAAAPSRDAKSAQPSNRAAAAPDAEVAKPGTEAVPSATTDSATVETGPAEDHQPQAEDVGLDQIGAADSRTDEAKPEAPRHAETDAMTTALPAADSTGDEFTAVDITRGNGLLVPLPATVEPTGTTGRLATLHPWRTLRLALGTRLETVWALPRSRFSYELNRLFDGQYLADHPTLRPVGEPGAVTRAVAGAPAAE
jgi:hypothetical protein